jgi:hypothetical protein
MSILDKLSVTSPVIIRPIVEMCYPKWTNKNFRYEGTVKNIRYHYINLGAKDWGKEKVVYIGFMDLGAYNNLLMQGSNIWCSVHGNLMTCYITTISRDSSNNIVNLAVAIYDDDIIKPFPITYNISVNDIEGMLIKDGVYQIQKV